jgi:hypothetical protein
MDMEDERRKEKPDDRIDTNRFGVLSERLEEERQRRAIAQKARRTAAARTNEPPYEDRNS